MKRDMTTGNITGTIAGDDFCYYYLHTNGELIHKTRHYDTSGFEESDFVVCWWKINLADRRDAYNFLISARRQGANESRVQELMKHWGITNEDAENYVKAVGLEWGVDGSAFYVHAPEFRNLQEDDAGFGDTLFDAICNFYEIKLKAVAKS